jgi:hypothetical protein
MPETGFIGRAFTQVRAHPVGRSLEDGRRREISQKQQEERERPGLLRAAPPLQT